MYTARKHGNARYDSNMHLMMYTDHISAILKSSPEPLDMVSVNLPLLQHRAFLQNNMNTYSDYY